MSNERVVVVGAGMVGLATAWHLQRGGAQVTVVERYDVAAGSSWGNAGWLSPALTLPLPEPAILATGVRAALSPQSPVYVPLTANPRLLRFLAGFARHCTDRHWHRAMDTFVAANARALDAYDELAADPEFPVQVATKPATPFLAAFASEQDRAVLVEEFARVNEAGGSVEYTLLDRTELHALEPALGEAAACGVSVAGQRYINPGDFVHALADAVKAAGAEILTGRDVAGVDQRGTETVVRFADGTDLAADAVVLANGAWLGRLARPHGVRALVQAGRGYSFTVHPEQQPANPVYLPTQRVACTPLGGPADGLRVAGMMEFRRPEAPLDSRRIEAIVAAAAPMLGGVDWSQRTDEWVGSRPCTADGLPLVGRTRSDRVFVAGGHGMWGIALGPLTGRVLADQVLHGRTDDLLRAFDPLR
jgi:D-amino-acid dehydrogenase